MKDKSELKFFTITPNNPNDDFNVVQKFLENEIREATLIPRWKTVFIPWNVPGGCLYVYQHGQCDFNKCRQIYKGLELYSDDGEEYARYYRGIFIDA